MTDVRLYGTMASQGCPCSEEPAPRSTAQMIAPFVAEYLGTFVIVFTVSCCLLAPGNPVWNATAIGCVLMVMVYAMGPISGGQLNPAVSLALALVGLQEWPLAVSYAVLQLVGGISAGLSAAALFYPMTVQVEAGPGFSTGYAMVAEAAYTCLLCFVFCNYEASRRRNPKDERNQFYSLAVGFSVVAAGYAVGTVSGACVNPAVAIGLDVAALYEATGLGWRWAAAELLAAVVAAALYREVRREEDQPGEELYKPTLGTKCLAEFLGTFVLVFTFGMNLVAQSPALAWSVAASLMCMTFAVGDVSGGHFNPAVTFAVVLSGRGRCTPREGFAFFCAQLVAGLAASLSFVGFHAKSIRKRDDYGLRPGAGYDWEAAAVSELFFTFVLAYVALACTCTGKVAAGPSRMRQSACYALAVGGCVAAGGFSAGAVSGGELNPSVCLGLTAETFLRGKTATLRFAANGLIFSASELLGGVLAAAAFRRTHPVEFESRLP